MSVLYFAYKVMCACLFEFESNHQAQVDSVCRFIQVICKFKQLQSQIGYLMLLNALNNLLLVAFKKIQ